MVGDAGSRVLDAGCGNGKGAIALANRGYRLTLCDITPDGLTEDARLLPFHQLSLWSDIRKQVGFHDWIYCCDVMEHIPTEFTMLVLARLADCARYGIFLSISFEPDQFGALIGKKLHQTVKPFTWWRDHLAEFGTVKEARDLMGSGVFLLSTRDKSGQQA